MPAEAEGLVLIQDERDLLTSRRKARAVAVDLGFRLVDVTRIVTAASELARNILHHGGAKGTMRWKLVAHAGRRGLELTFEDEGPGIEDIDRALQEGYTTAPSASLGMGLPGTKRLVDDMEMRSVVGEGTTVVIRKWLPMNLR